MMNAGRRKPGDRLANPLAYSRTRTDRLIPAAFQQAAVGVEAAGAQEGPGAALGFGARGIDVGEDHALAFGVHAREDLAAGAGDERVAPEAQVAFAPDAVGGGDEQAVDDGVAALDGHP